MIYDIKNFYKKKTLSKIISTYVLLMKGGMFIIDNSN